MSEFKEVKKRQQKTKEEEDPTELESLSGEFLDDLDFTQVIKSRSYPLCRAYWYETELRHDSLGRCK